MASIFAPPASSSTGATGSIFAPGPGSGSHGATLESLAGGAAPGPAAGGGGGLLGSLMHLPLALFNDLRDFGGSLAKLGGEGIHDVGRAAANVLPGHQSWGFINDTDTSGFHLDDVITNLPSGIRKAYGANYGPLVHGHVGTFAQQFAEHPLSYLLDLGAVAGAAAKGVGLAGEATLAGTDAARTADITSQALQEAGIANRGGGFLVKGLGKADAAGVRAGLEQLAARGELSPTMSAARHLLPSSTAKLVEGEGLVTGVTAQNPLYRSLLAPAKRLMTEPIAGVEDQLAQVRASIESAAQRGIEPMAQDRAAYAHLTNILDDAKAVGLTRIDKPKVATFNAWRSGGRLIADAKGKALLARQELSKRYIEPIVAAIKEDPTVTDTFHLQASGLDVNVEGLTPAKWAKKPLYQAPEARTVPLRQPALVGAGGGGMGAAAVVDARLPAEELAAAAKVTPAFAQRSQAVLDKLQGFIDNLENNRAQMEQNGWDVTAQVDGAQRVQRAVSEGLRRQVAHASKKEVIPAGIRAQDEVRLVDLERNANGWERMYRTPKDILDRAYFPLRQKYGARFVGDQLEGGPSVAQLDDSLHGAGVAQPVYYPYMDLNNLKSSDFFTSKQLRGANIYAKDASDKQLKGALLREGTYVTDPVEAYTRRAARAVRAQETFNLFDTMIKHFGRVIPDAESLPNGWVAVSPDQLFIQHRTHMSFLNRLDELTAEGKDADAAIATAVRETSLTNMRDIDSALAGGAKVYAVPKVVVDQLNAASRWASFGGKNARLFWDTPQQVWRGLVLTGSPRWIINNLLGNTIFAGMQGVKTADALRILGEHFRAMASAWAGRHGGEIGQSISELLGPGEIRAGSLAGRVRALPGAEAIGSGFSTNSLEQYRPQLGLEAAKTTTGKLIQKAQMATGRTASGIRTYTAFMRHVNGEVEDAFREASYLTAAEKAVGKTTVQRTARTFWRSKHRVEDLMASGFDEVKATQALKEVNSFFGDYSHLSPFERHMVRRFVFPFYSFYRHATKLILTYPFENPLRATVINALAAADQEMMDQYGPVPEWLRSAVPLSAPGSEVSFLTGAGPNPFNVTGQDWVSGLNPMLKVALERSIGRDLFTGRTYSDENVFTPYGSDVQIDMRTGKPIEGHVLPSPIEQFLSNIPQYTTLKKIVAGGKTYDTATLLDVLQGHGVIKDTAGATKYPTQTVDEILKYLGLPTTTYDLGSYQQRLADAQAQAAQQGAA